MTPVGRKALLLGSGELGKEVAIELQRYGVEVIACDRYANAPAMQIAHRCYVFNMLDGEELRRIVEIEKPDHIIPEVEAIATNVLLELEKEGYNVTPTANAAWLTMNREGIRRLAAEELGIKTSPYRFASTREEFQQAVEQIGLPCVIKPIMSSSGHGQSVARTADDIERSSLSGTTYCQPIGHIQIDGDYRYSWQPQPMTTTALEKAQEIAKKVTDALGGYGIFGVELFIKGNDVIFSEVSPRPHDTGMVTMISQDLSEFGLHARALLGLPVPDIRFYGPSASRAIVIEGDTDKVEFDNLEEALKEPGVQIRIFGKPEVKGHRRMGVLLATDSSVEAARDKAERAYQALKINILPR